MTFSFPSLSLLACLVLTLTQARASPRQLQMADTFFSQGKIQQTSDIILKFTGHNWRQLNRAQQVKAHKILGVCGVILGNIPLARRSFRRAFRLNSYAKLRTSEKISPQVERIFEETRRQFLNVRRSLQKKQATQPARGRQSLSHKLMRKRVQLEVRFNLSPENEKYLKLIKQASFSVNGYLRKAPVRNGRTQIFLKPGSYTLRVSVPRYHSTPRFRWKAQEGTKTLKILLSKQAPSRVLNKGITVMKAAPAKEDTQPITEKQVSFSAPKRKKRKMKIAKQLPQNPPTWLSFLPFGAPQYDQGRGVWGTLYLTAQTASLGLAIGQMLDESKKIKTNANLSSDQRDEFKKKSQLIQTIGYSGFGLLWFVSVVQGRLQGQKTQAFKAHSIRPHLDKHGPSVSWIYHF